MPVAGFHLPRIFSHLAVVLAVMLPVMLAVVLAVTLAVTLPVMIAVALAVMLAVMLPVMLTAGVSVISSPNASRATRERLSFSLSVMVRPGRSTTMRSLPCW